MAYQASSGRIAKNTLILYLRMFILMLISLYTSRVVLQQLGVEDFGTYNAVGGFVAMFTMLTSSISGAISRFLTVELGRENNEKLRTVFSTSIKVQLLMAAIVFVLAETIGLWFVRCRMQIPAGREDAAFVVLQCAIVGFAMSLVSTPFSATVIAHEKMSAYATLTILDAVLKLGVAFLISVCTFDKLKFYATLLLSVHAVMFLLYALFCKQNFDECRGKSSFDKGVFKELWKFAGWTYLGNTAYVFNTQGVNMLMNIFFGVTVNAARGIANQVNGIIGNFAGNFTTALCPQITKSYASGDKQTAFSITCTGAKFTYYLMLILAVPVILEIDQLLSIWLVNPPAGAAEFAVWTILATLTSSLGTTLLTLVNASGNIKRYQIVMAICGFLPFPSTWIAFKLGASAMWAYFIYFAVYYVLVFVRLLLVNHSTGIPIRQYLKEAVLTTHIATILASIAPILVIIFVPATPLRILLTCSVSIISCGTVIFTIGLRQQERDLVLDKLHQLIARKS